MAAAGTISSIFDLVFEIAGTGAETYTVSDLRGRRSFRVLGARVFNVGGVGTISITSTGPGGTTIVTSQASANGAWKNLTLVAGAAQEVGVDQGIAFTINASGANFAAGSRLIISCIVGGSGTPITVTTP